MTEHAEWIRKQQFASQLEQWAQSIRSGSVELGKALIQIPTDDQGKVEVYFSVKGGK